MICRLFHEEKLVLKNCKSTFRIAISVEKVYFIDSVIFFRHHLETRKNPFELH